MNKKQFIRKYAEYANLKICEYEKILKSLSELITDMVASGEKINIHGFLEISTKEVKDRMGTDPRTAKPILIKGGTKVVFRPGSILRAAARSVDNSWSKIKNKKNQNIGVQYVAMSLDEKAMLLHQQGQCYIKAMVVF